MNNEKINAHQFKVLIIVTFIGTSVLNTPSALTSKAKHDGWISAVLGVALTLILVWFYSALGKQLGNMSIVEYTKKLLGKWLGSFISFTFVLFLFLNSTALVWIVGTFMVTQLMPETPMIIINTAFIFVIVIGTKLGFEVIARSAELLYPWALGGLIILLILVLPEIQIKHLQPVFENGMNPIMQGGVLFMSFTPLTFVVFLMIFPSLINNFEQGKKAFFKGMLLAGCLLIILTLICILVLGAESTARNVYPSYVLSKKISIGKFIERIEAIFGMVWIVTIFFKTIIYFYSTAVGFTQVLGLKDYKPFTYPLGMLIVLFSQIIYPNTVYAAKWDSTTWISYVFTYGFIFPLLLFIVGKLRHSKG